jgi:hypothetical protein
VVGSVQLVMEKVINETGAISGYKVLAKRYRRRKPELRNGSIKWFDDKAFRTDLEEAATAEDQRRVDIAWRVVRKWLRHYDESIQGPPPEYDAVDANYYVTWGHFAEWVNAMLEHLPGEIEALRGGGGESEKSHGLRRASRAAEVECVSASVSSL